MSQERERKFLVASGGWQRKAGRGVTIRQGYLSTDPERSVRVRIAGHRAFLGVKVRAGASGPGLSRAEFEYPIPLEDATTLLERHCRKPLIEKRRFHVRDGRQVWEVDRFAAENQGLELAELEESSGEAPQSLPGWVGQEVSGDERFENANLVEHPFSGWQRKEPPETKYRLKNDESLAKGFERLFREQIQLALWNLSENAAQLDDSIHEARKAMKRARSLLRLLRGAFKEVYERDNGVMRSIGRKLSPARDAHALIEMFDDLVEEGELVSVRQGLAARRDRIGRSLRKSGEIQRGAAALRALAGRIHQTSWTAVNLETVWSGFNRGFRRGKRALEAVEAGPKLTTLHELRKRAKDLRYHLAVLKQPWKEVIGGYSDSAKDLEQRLGDDHNLAIIRQTVFANPHVFGSRKDLRQLAELIDKRRAKLQREAVRVAALVYRDTPSDWRSRLERLWDKR